MWHVVLCVNAVDEILFLLTFTIPPNNSIGPFYRPATSQLSEAKLIIYYGIQQNYMSFKFIEKNLTNQKSLTLLGNKLVIAKYCTG